MLHLGMSVLDTAEDFVDFRREDVGVWRRGSERVAGRKEESNEG
jgi:hypothetical protein